MPDEVDLASSLIDNELARAIADIRKNAAVPKVGSKVCVECDDDMPAVRQSLGFRLCVTCAEEKERRKQLFAD